MVETLSPSVPPEVEQLVCRVVAAACGRSLRLATAESCTGGLLASLLTDVEGWAHAFERGFVTYTDEAKSEMLGVPPGLIASAGAVSRSVARAMAVGGLAASKADICLSITGFAGPGAPGDEPGLVWFGLARHGAAPETLEKHFGDIGRGGVRVGCLKVGLELLMAAIAD